MTSACATCVYWDKAKLGPTVGICRFNAPAPPNQSQQATNNVYWSVTAQDDWCGQFTSTPPATQMPVASGVAASQPNITVVTDTMLGCGSIAGFSIVPVRTGRIIAIISGTLTSSTANAQINITGRHGTGTAPANGTGATGQLWATTQHYFTSTAKDVNGFTVIGGNVGLALNTAFWFDVSVASPAGGVTTIADVQSLLFEL